MTDRPVEPGPHATAAEKAQHAQEMADWTAGNPAEEESAEDALERVGLALIEVKDRHFSADGPRRLAIEEALKLIAAAMDENLQSEDKGAKRSRSRPTSGSADSGGGDAGSHEQ